MSDEQAKRFVDRSGWPSGPWDDEDDRYEWRHAGCPCLIVRGPRGALCGYVGVSEGHPAYRSSYSAHYNDDGERHETPLSAADLRVHGGLTYANACAGRICHVPEPGEPDDVWWIGFDCAHSWDLVPGADPCLRSLDAIYRDAEYVRRETNCLAEQLAEMKR